MLKSFFTAVRNKNISNSVFQINVLSDMSGMPTNRRSA
jgi:hypothetical protein